MIFNLEINIQISMDYCGIPCVCRVSGGLNSAKSRDRLWQTAVDVSEAVEERDEARQ